MDHLHPDEFNLLECPVILLTVFYKFFMSNNCDPVESLYFIYTGIRYINFWVPLFQT
jgi:hypothetical protein